MGLVREDPWHVVVETLLLFFILYLVFKKRSRKDKSQLTEAEINELIADWKPAPLVPPLTVSEAKTLARNVVVEKFVSADEVLVRGSSDPKLNLTTFDFLGLSAPPSNGSSNGKKKGNGKGEAEEGKDHCGAIKAVAKATMEHYGCGSCGPRGFYGSVMPHIEIENAVASFLGMEGAISYSDTAQTQTSTIPAFAKKGDLIFADACVNQSLKVGLELSRSKVVYFRHNDMVDLEAKLSALKKEDKRLGRDALLQRRFIVTEGLFKADGSMCPLKEIISLKDKHGFRLILDETLSFGVLGANGRGLSEHLGVSAPSIDILVVTLEYSLASIGGVCLGSLEVVDHQRLSGAGYCFSASAPPFVSSAALEALKILGSDGASLLGSLRANIASARRAMTAELGPWFEVLSHEASPVIHLALNEATRGLLSAAFSEASGQAEAERAKAAAAALSAEDEELSLGPNGSPLRGIARTCLAASPAASPGAGEAALGSWVASFNGSFNGPDAEAESALQAEALSLIAEKCLAAGFLLAAPKRMKGEALQGAPTLRFVVRASLKEEAITAAVDAIRDACRSVFKTLGSR